MFPKQCLFDVYIDEFTFFLIVHIRFTLTGLKKILIYLPIGLSLRDF